MNSWPINLLISLSSANTVPPLPFTHPTVVPIFSQYIIKFITFVYLTSPDFWKDMSAHIMDPVKHVFWLVWPLLTSFTPPWLVVRVVGILTTVGKMIPSGMWQTIPFTILTIGQTSILLPWALNHVEQFFRWAANNNAAKEKYEKQRGNRE